MEHLILKSLAIRNFRAFHDLTIEHLGRVNLIVGKNNVGKTSLLEALRLYTSRASTPTFLWEMMNARRDMKQSFVNVRDMLEALKDLFHGRNAMTPGLQPIQIGPLNSSQKMLSIAIDWTITETRNGTLQTRLLEPGEASATDTLAPRLTLQVAETRTSYPLDPSLPQGMLRLNANEIACIFISSNGLTERHLAELWDRIALTKLEADVLGALHLVAPGVVNLNFVSSPLSRSERIPLVKIAGADEPLLLHTLGDGMFRVLSIALALVNARNGILLIDEFENGLYYTVQPGIWHCIFRVARRLNVQVFATTHSWDCIEAFQHAVQEGRQDEGLLLRLESKQSDIVATTFDKRKLGMATREHIEVR